MSLSAPIQVNESLSMLNSSLELTFWWCYSLNYVFVKEGTVQNTNLLSYSQQQEHGDGHLVCGFSQQQSKGNQKHFAHNIVKTCLNNLRGFGGKMFLWTRASQPWHCFEPNRSVSWAGGCTVLCIVGYVVASLASSHRCQ